MEKYLQGFLMGLAYVAPIGVQNLFVINSAITQKRSKTLLIALIVIFFDITLFSHKFNNKVLRVINIVCGIVIIFYGLKLLLNFYKIFIHYIY